MRTLLINRDAPLGGATAKVARGGGLALLGVVAVDDTGAWIAREQSDCTLGA